MFFPSDITTEIVAHFVGYFELSVEDLRLRLELQDYVPLAVERDRDSSLETQSANLTQRFSLGDFQPGVPYSAPDWLITGHPDVRLAAPDDPGSAAAPQAAQRLDVAMPEYEQDTQDILPQIAPQLSAEPGSVFALISQQVLLIDNDTVILGDFDGSITFNSGADATILGLQAQAAGIADLLGNGPELDHYTGAGDFVVAAAAHAHALLEIEAPPGITIITPSDGTVINGAVAAEAPDLQDHLPVNIAARFETDPAAVEAEESAQSIVLKGDDIEQSVTLNAGGNLLANEISVVNGGIYGSILAVQGNYHQLDAIIQINAYSDNDTIIDAPGGQASVGPETQAFNIASFETETRDGLAKVAEANPGSFPASWTVSVVSGDLVFIEWMKQFTFQSDQDISVLSATGANTVVTTGENVGLNSISFTNLGVYYDLVIVGGNFYDANIIVQTNILYDNDTIQYLGPGHGGTGQLATQGNLLWNEASIHNIGPTEFDTEMPEHFTAAMSNLSTGAYEMPEGFGSEALFEGLGLLRVLYVAGDIYDLRYLQQTNVLGDADFVALQQARVLSENPGTDWDINTGANALVNQAAIFDFDGVGDIAYVAGEHYSDAILIQANILVAEPAGGGGDALVSEVIAFLDTEIPDSPGDDSLFSSSISHDGPPADIMQSVLA